jgi:hypothetical protein
MVFGSESKSWPMTKWLDVNRQQMSQIAPSSREHRLLGLDLGCSRKKTRESALDTYRVTAAHLVGMPPTLPRESDRG